MSDPVERIKETMFQNSRRVEGVEAPASRSRSRRRWCFRTLGESKALKQPAPQVVYEDPKFQNSRRVEGVEAQPPELERARAARFRTLGESKALKPCAAGNPPRRVPVSELSASRRR